MKKIVVSLLLAIASSTFSQNISGDAAKLNTELKSLMAATKNPDAIKVSTDFEAVYAQLSEPQKQKIAAQLQNLQKKKLKAHPTLSGYMLSLVKASQFGVSGGVKMDSLLIMNSYAFDNFKYAKDYENYNNGLLNLFVNKAVGTSLSNFTKIQTNNLSFRVIQDPSQAPEAPANNEVLEKTQEVMSEWDNEASFENNFTAGFDESSTQPTAEDVLNAVDVPPMPQLTGAVIVFKDANIQLGNKYDSTGISGASGMYSFTNNMMVCNGGSVSWKNLGKPNITCKLENYAIDPNSAQIEAFDAVLTYDEILETTVKGVYEYKCIKSKDTVGTYPRFISYTGGVKIKNLGDNIKYTGGLSLKGTHVLSKSLDESKSKIEIYKGETKVITALSPMFELSKDQITSPLVSVVLFLNTDSISHPGVNFEYSKGTRTLKLKNQSAAFRNTAYSDTYHNIEVVAEYVSWNLDKTEIDFSMITGRAESPAIFTSIDYFNEKEFNAMKGLYKFHPLFIVNTYMRDTKTKNGEITVSGLAKQYNTNEQTMGNAIYELNKKGFVDINKGYITLKRKGYHYIKSKEGKKDYDQIKIFSKEKSKANATLNLENMEMTVRGVEKFFLSEKLNVFIMPENKEVKIQKNRDFKFDGKLLTSDMLSFFGKEMRFDYDSFFVDMKNIDSLKMRVKTKEKDAAGKFIVKDLKSQLEQGAGELFVNKTYNRSAKKDFPEYPIFKSKKGSFIYYDKPFILNGIYAKQVYFEIPPFTIDSLTVMTEPLLDGTFKSGGIFPDIKERVRPNPEDLSLGFDHKIPKEGYKVYEGKGKFYKSFSISNKGIRGDGELEYLTGKYRSNDFVFYPDSLLSIGQSADIKDEDAKKTEFAEVATEQFDMFWYCKKDSMLVSSVDEPFKMYNKSVDWSGKLIVQPSGLKGEGTLETRGSETSSLNFSFKKHTFLAREAFFKILSNDPTKAAVESKNVHVDFDLKTNHTKFDPEISGTASNTFPYLQYESSMEGGDWDLAKKSITFKKKDTANINSSYFLSMHPLQDSLIFNATDALYEMNKQTLTIHGVPYIFVGDSKVFPTDGQVVINENADMQELTKAKMIVDSTNKRYTLYDGNLKILSKTRVRGTAKYDYYNVDSVKNVLNFSDFYYRDVTLQRPSAEEIAAQDELIEQDVEENATEVENAGKKKKSSKKTKKVKVRKNKKKLNNNFHFEAIAEIAEKDSFLMAPQILYQGKAIIRADKEHLMFEGQVKMDLHAFKGLQQWIKYNNDGSTDNIAIDVKDAKADDGTPLYTGLFIDNSNYGIYSTYLSFKRYPEDVKVFEAKDNFSFDNKKAIFRVGDLAKIEGKKLQGNVFSYFDKKSTVSYMGNLYIIPENKDFMLKSSTLGNGLVDSTFYTFNTFMSLAVNIPAKALEVMGDGLRGASAAAMNPPAYTTKDTMAYKIADIYGEKIAQNFVKTMAVGTKPLFEYNKKFASSININEVNLNWSNKNSAFYSTGKIGVSNVYKKDVNFKMNGFVESKKGPNGDIFTIYLEPTSTTWYYLSFEANKLSVLSSDEMFNQAIRAKSKGEQSGGKYHFVLSESEEKTLFLKEFNQNYLGLEYKEPEIPIEEIKQDSATTIDVNKLEAPTPEPGEEGEQTTEEGGKKSKKSKKKKKSETVTEEQTPATEAAPAPATSPASTTPTQENVTPAENTTSPAETPAEDSENSKKKSKKKKEEKKKEEEGF